MVFVDQCLHILCKPCLKPAIEAHYPEVKCLFQGCKAKLQDWEVREILGKEAYEALQQKMATSFIEEDENIVRCKCGNAIEVVQGKVYYDYKNDEGKFINKTAAKHMSANRVRCNECGNNFCISCKVEPYHLGKTCAQYEKEKNAKKCRFCLAVLKPNQRGGVCSKRECKQMAWRCCSQFLACGHGCYGGGNEQVHPPCLHEECVAKDESHTLGENADSFCVICYVQGLGEKAVVQLGCKHIFHQDCLQRRIQQKWYQNQFGGFGGAAAQNPPDANANAISLKFAHCPSCN